MRYVLQEAWVCSFDYLKYQRQIFFAQKKGKSAMIAMDYNFKLAKPIWEMGKECELNYPMLFTAKLPRLKNALLCISGYTGYQVFVNGVFVCFGPARAGHGHYRVDEVEISHLLDRSENIITVRATGYYCASFEWLKQPSFICAEVISDGRSLIPTGGDAWRATPDTIYLRKIQRYSYQRTFAEAYDYRNRICAGNVEPSVCGEKRFMKRVVPYWDYSFLPAGRVVSSGTVVKSVTDEHYQNRFLWLADEENSGFDSFPNSQLDIQTIHAAEDIRLEQVSCENAELVLPIHLNKNSYATLSLERNSTGFISMELDCLTDTDLYLTFDEILCDGHIDFTRGECSNALLYRLRGGEHYNLLTAEPYTLKYLNIISMGGGIVLKKIGVVELAFPESHIIRGINEDLADEDIKKIYRAALETFRQNVTDIYMDCPSRERAGWLCDSFFTSRVEKLLTGKSIVEREFLSNFAMNENYPNIAAGTLPMCYPADFSGDEHRHGIPNWAMWFLLELKEYRDRTGDAEFVRDLRPKMERLLAYFRQYENADGLLERLPGWVFVEWSRCNELVQDINYPTNMLYYRFKLTMAELYGMAELAEEARLLRKTIRCQSLMDLFFCDNAVYGENGVAVLSGEATETCQYYAFFTGVATPAEDAELWNTMLSDFGPDRDMNGKWKDIGKSNAFIGNYLRLELLASAGKFSELEKNIREFFYGMAERTGTLWEHDDIRASCDHGFASHVLIWLDMLGYLKS